MADFLQPNSFQAELVFRLALAAIAGALVGVERELRDQAAGLRTHMLVALGACLFTLVSAYGFQGVVPADGLQRYDVTRVASNIVTGVGFLGAGTIIRQGFSIRGLTTAASLWVVAAIGTAVGLGMYFATGVSVIITIASLWGLRRVRTGIRKRAGFDRETIRLLAKSEDDLDAVMELIKERGHRIRGLDLDEPQEGEGVHARLRIHRINRSDSMEDVVASVSRLEGVSGAEWEGS